LYALRDLLSLISGELQKEPSSIEKMGRIRLKAFFPPTQLVDHFAEIGLSAADIASTLAKVSGFVIGEAAGHSVGVIGFGGAVGLGATFLAERVVDEFAVTPKRERAFGQVAHLLTDEANSEDLA